MNVVSGKNRENDARSAKHLYDANFGTNFFPEHLSTKLEKKRSFKCIQPHIPAKVLRSFFN